MKSFLTKVILVALICATAMLGGCSSETVDRKGSANAIDFTVADEIDAEKIDRYDQLITAFANNEVATADCFDYVLTDSGVTLNSLKKDISILVIPDTIEGKQVTAIAENAFADNTILTAVCIPESVTTIGTGAFSGCDNIKTMKLPLIVPEGDIFARIFGASSYLSNAIKTPKALETLILTGTQTSVPPYAFFECGSVKNVILPDTVTEICKFAFYDCNDLEYIHYSNSLKSICDHAFAFCSALTYIDFPSSVESIGLGAYEDCPKITGITTPIIGGGNSETGFFGYIFGAEKYGWGVGYIPSSLQHVIISDGCKEIPTNAFFECNSIKDIVLPNSVEKVGVRAFYGCYSLKSIELPDNCTVIGDEAFYNCINLKSAVGSGVKTIGMQCFYGCIALDTANFEAVVSIGNLAFHNCPVNKSSETQTYR